jgi:hypothetical protein
MLTKIWPGTSSGRFKRPWIESMAYMQRHKAELGIPNSRSGVFLPA